MAVLRPLAELAAAKARELVEIWHQALVDTVIDDFRVCPVPEPERKFIPCREGKSLYAYVKPRVFFRRKHPARIQGFNHGEKVNYHDNL
jgi:hypothetical protein